VEKTSLDYLLMLPDFNYLSPKFVRQAYLMLSKYRTDAKIMAGGTDLQLILLIPGYNSILATKTIEIRNYVENYIHRDTN
jgi:CO/xanthine dehydrogenase FAD-binding subunit